MPETKNERLALLLGWGRCATHLGEEWYKQVSTDGLHITHRHPKPEGVDLDFDQWERFPELQAYIRGLDVNQRRRLNDAIWPRHSSEDLLPGRVTAVATITPGILGSALLEVCDA